ncbi:MAG: phosphatase PAP2 family protein [Desulfobacteraceae bacterium]|nr:MAG: phosphatase PAP2 family protein [Desulfobacteraceae bacterium]
METVLSWGMGLIVAVQEARSAALDHFFLSVTALGDDLFYMLALPLFYWCIDKRRALRFYYLFMLSSWLNSVAKETLQQPRPFDLNAKVKVGNAGGPGLPSGHAQGSLVFWGYLGLWFRRRWFAFMCIALICLVAFSRIYLGVHFPTDILGGWFLGLLLLLPFDALADRIEARLAQVSMKWKIVLGTGLPVLLALVVPSKWSVSPMGTTAGFTLAVLIERGRLGHAMPRGILRAALRYFSGIAGLFIIYFALKPFIPKGSSYYLPLVFAHYYILGFWVGFGAPWLFRKTGLEPKAYKPESGILSRVPT